MQDTATTTATGSLFKFEHPDFPHPFHVQTTGGQARFVLKDYCANLGIKNPADAATSLPDEHVFKVTLTPDSIPVLAVDLAGLLELLHNSRKPKAPAFRDWLATAIIPAVFPALVPTGHDSPGLGSIAAHLARGKSLEDAVYMALRECDVSKNLASSFSIQKPPPCDDFVTAEEDAFCLRLSQDRTFSKNWKLEELAEMAQGWGLFEDTLGTTPGMLTGKNKADILRAFLQRLLQIARRDPRLRLYERSLENARFEYQIGLKTYVRPDIAKLFIPLATGEPAYVAPLRTLLDMDLPPELQRQFDALASAAGRHLKIGG